jgi:hypothetical protein
MGSVKVTAFVPVPHQVVHFANFMHHLCSRKAVPGVYYPLGFAQTLILKIHAMPAKSMLLTDFELNVPVGFLCGSFAG